MTEGISTDGAFGRIGAYGSAVGAVDEIELGRSCGHVAAVRAGED